MMVEDWDPNSVQECHRDGKAGNLVQIEAVMRNHYEGTEGVGFRCSAFFTFRFILAFTSVTSTLIGPNQQSISQLDNASRCHNPRRGTPTVATSWQLTLTTTDHQSCDFAIIWPFGFTLLASVIGLATNDIIRSHVKIVARHFDYMPQLEIHHQVIRSFTKWPATLLLRKLPLDRLKKYLATFSATTLHWPCEKSTT